jgi:hypothetical protein
MPHTKKVLSTAWFNDNKEFIEWQKRTKAKVISTALTYVGDTKATAGAKSFPSFVVTVTYEIVDSLVN